MKESNVDVFNECQRAISENSDIVDFGTPDKAPSDEWIVRAEEALGIIFPKSYLWWLANYAFGEIGGEELFSIYCQDFDTVSGGDIVHASRVYNLEGAIPICSSDVDGLFAFDIHGGMNSGEYAILHCLSGSVYAKSFAEFIIKRISLFLE